MTSHKTLKKKRVKCDADVSILDAPLPLVIICQHCMAGPLPLLYADVIFAHPLQWRIQGGYGGWNPPSGVNFTRKKWENMQFR